MKILIFGYNETVKMSILALLKQNYVVHLAINEKHKALANYFGTTKLKIPIIYYTDIQEKTILNTLKNINPHYIFSILIPDRIPNTIIQTAQNGAFNIHPSKLPKYRSACPWYWLLKNQETQSAITIHTLTEKWDSGDIIYQKTFNIHPEETKGSYISRLTYLIPLTLTEIETQLKTNTFTYTKQPKAPYYTTPTTAERTLNWQQTATQLHHHIRAGNPRSHALTTYKNITLQLLESTQTNIPSTTLPGTLHIQDNNLYVSTKDNLLKLDIIETPNEGVYTGYKFAQQFNLQENEKFI